MSETSNIAEMAKKVAEEIFEVFGWRRVGGVDRNWECVEPQRHDGRKTHPSDVVFAYDDPYSPNVVLVNTDLKAYKHGSITHQKIAPAVKSLVQATECLQCSEEWQNAYANGLANWQGVGLLFVFNTDGEYDNANFLPMLESIAEENRAIADGRRVFVMGPADVAYLWSVADDIGRFRQRYEARAQFFYHQRVVSRARQGYENSASLEVLMSPWQVVRLHEAKKPFQGARDHFIFYYRGPGTSNEEFVYLIDVLFRLELLRDSDVRLDIRLVNSADNATEKWRHAIDIYVFKFRGLPNLREQLARVEVSSVTRTSPRFSTVEIGLES